MRTALPTSSWRASLIHGHCYNTCFCSSAIVCHIVLLLSNPQGYSPKKSERLPDGSFQHAEASDQCVREFRINVENRDRDKFDSSFSSVFCDAFGRTSGRVHSALSGNWPQMGHVVSLHCKEYHLRVKEPSMGENHCKIPL